VEEIFDVCLEKIEEGMSVDKILEEYPEHREKLREMLVIANDLENVPLPRLREEAVASCLVKVRDALQLQKKPVWRVRLSGLQWSRLFYFPSPALAKALALALMVIFISWAAVNLSADSLPGDILYPAKLTTERVRFFLTTDPDGKAELRLAYSEERAQELVRYLDEKGKLHIPVLKAMLDEAALVTYAIQRLSRDEGIVHCLKLERLCAHQKNLLEGLKSRVPFAQRQELDNAIQLCHHRHEWMGKVIRNEVPIGEWGPFVLNET
jgi:hypothetical protein